jgi:toxin CptA
MQRHFALHPSNYLTLTIFIAHAIVMAALLFLPFPNVALILLLIVLSWSMTYYMLRDARLKLDSSYVALRLEDDHIALIDLKGGEVTGELLRSSMVMPHLVVLNIAVQGQRQKRNVVLMSDSMDAESFRRLRVALKWRMQPTA